ncbi:hypothetical protein JCM8097_005963 [Rhodosporidiobolus ruineniae]
MSPVSSYASISHQPWPDFLPPSLAALSDPRPHPNLGALPPSRRPASNRGHATMQDELDELDQEEDDFYNRMMDIRQYGYSWLVPLGRQHTHDDDAESVFDTSALAGDGNATFDSLGQPIPAFDAGADGGGGAPGGAGGEAQDEAPVRDLDAEIEDADAETGSESEGEGSEVGGGRGRAGGGGVETEGEESMQT